MSTLISRYLSLFIPMLLWTSGQWMFAETVSDELTELSTPQVIAKILEVKNENNVEAALGFLSKEMDRRAGDPSNFGALFSGVWTEAQVKSGRLDEDWSARLYDQLFISAHKHRHYSEMNDVMGNLLGTMGTAGRHGRQTEILEWWAEGQKAGSKLLETTAYPDLGPALPFLPEVRKRNIPETLLYSRIEAKESAPASLVDIGQKNTQIFSIYAGHLGNAGRWRQSMEWQFQVRRWASLENGSPRWQLIQAWFRSVESIALWLQWHGFLEEALAQVDEGLAAPMQNSYHGRCNISFSLERLVLLMELNRAPEDLVDQAKNLAKRSEENMHISAWSHRYAKVIVAKALLHKGANAEGLEMLGNLADAGFIPARNARLEYWIDKSMLERVEAELISLLKDSRASGNKSAESWLYEKYADFLESSGRLSEALSMRREVIRLYQSFDHFTRIPIQLAKLAILLERMGDMVGSKAAADEARGLIAQGKLPASRKNLAESALSKLNQGHAVAVRKPERTPQVDFQPERSIVIPIEGAAWTTLLTLANPSDKAEVGTLSYRGRPMTFTREGEQGDVVVQPVTDGEQGDATFRLRLEPSSYQLIRITADQTLSKESELSLIWNSWGGETRVEANVQIKAPEKGVSSSVIQAGNYHANPFYGVPVYLYYVTRDKVTKSLPLRFITSQASRIEVYSLDGKPLSVDAQGNGSLRDRGDELFGASDREGNLLLTLTDGAASFMVLMYPNGPLPAEGLNLNVEAYQDGAWSLHSQNRLMP
jgi:tetratricopeptide (TPR) repeat protein